MTKMTVLHDYSLDLVHFLCFYMSLIDNNSIAHFTMVLSATYVPERESVFFVQKN